MLFYFRFFVRLIAFWFTYNPTSKCLSIHTVTLTIHIFTMSLIKAEPVDHPCISVAIATGQPKLEIVVDDETVVKTDPDSVYYNGPFVKDVSSVKEDPLNADSVYFVLSSFVRVRICCMPFTGSCYNPQT